MNEEISDVFYSYAAVLSARDKTYGVKSVLIVLDATNYSEATGIAYEYAKRNVFPKGEYMDIQVSVQSTRKPQK